MIDVDVLDDLPFRSNIRKTDRRHRSGVYHNIDNVSPYTIANRIVEHYIGRSFDLAYSHFCKIVPIYQQKLFIDNLNPRYYKNYHIDDSGILRKIEKAAKNKTVTFESCDYKTCSVYKIGNKKFKKSDIRYESLFLNKFKNENITTDTEAESGFKITFSSKNDPLYKRLIIEEQKKIKKIKRRAPKKKYSTKNIFLSLEEREYFATH